MAVATEREYGLFINGESAEPASGELRDLVEPATGEPLAKVAVADEADVDRAVDAARAALEGDWARTAPTERSRLLHALADALVANRKELAELEARNVGKAISSVKAELAPGRRELPLLRLGDRVDRRPLEPDRRLAPLLLAEGAGRRLRPDRALELPADDDDLEARARARRRLHRRAQAGLGDAALRAAAWPSWPPRSASRPATINVVPGPRPDRRRAPRAAPRASRRSRSPARPRRARRSCGSPPSGIKRLILELGGKSPNLVFADADLDDAIPSSVWSIYYSAGQSCEARSRVLVESSVYDDFVGALQPRRRTGSRSATRSTRRRRSAR